MAHNTGNPIGSADPRDLYDNAQSFDHAVNDLESSNWTDRLGQSRKTWKGVEDRIEQILVAGGKIFASDEDAISELTVGDYYYVESGSSRVSLEIRKKITETDSTHIKDTPTLSYVDDAASAAVSIAGAEIGLSPYLGYGDDLDNQQVDSDGWVIGNDLLVQSLAYMGIAHPAPFLGYEDDYLSTTVSASGMVLESKWKAGYPDTTLAPFDSFEDDVVVSFIDKAGNVALPVGSADASDAEIAWSKPIHLKFDADQHAIFVSWRHSDSILLRHEWRPNGANDLFNFRAVYKAYGNSPEGPWELISAVSTDWIPPITHYAVNEPNSPNIGTTGGNHTGENGERTAAMRSLDLHRDGQPLTENFSGYVNDVTAHWVNDLYAGNTVNEERYTTVQEVHCRFTPRNIEVYCKVTALEPIQIVREGGTQLTGSGWEDCYHFYGGEQKGSVPGDSEVYDSGARQDAPDVWACVLKDSELGYCASWLDREYGVKNESVRLADPLATKNVNSYKFYNFSVKHEDSETRPTLAGGASYRWRGGYSYSPIDMVNGLDSGFVYRQGGSLRLALANTVASLNGEFSIPQGLAARDFDGLGAASVIPIETNFSQYTAKGFKESK